MLHLIISLGMIGCSLDVSDFVGVGENSEKFIDEFCALVSDENFWYPMPADHIFIEEGCN